MSSFYIHLLPHTIGLENDQPFTEIIHLVGLWCTRVRNPEIQVRKNFKEGQLFPLVGPEQYLNAEQTYPRTYADDPYFGEKIWIRVTQKTI